MTQSSGQAPVNSEIVGTIPTSDLQHLREELIDALPTVIGVLRLSDIESVVGIVKYR